MWAATIGNTPTTQLAGYQGGSAYKSGYDSATSKLAKLPLKSLVQGCAGGAGQWMGVSPSRPGNNEGHHPTTGRTARE
jgi:hypothetical protein